ncbi:MAG TPA: creatininase family protein [Fimbriimonadaceae bacterium]|nr:creatininase family protein [Fimbriimonadaceae bacterium]
MKLGEMTWKEVDALDRETVVILPTGSLEQHGLHLPLLTDTILVTAVAEAVERNLTSSVLLVPTLWLGASTHHLAYTGSLSASSDGYYEAVAGVVDSLADQDFTRFFIINGHGGNKSSNDIAARELKVAYEKASFCVSNYWDGIDKVLPAIMEGPLKTIRHACEGETSLMLHVRPELVHMDRAQDDGLVSKTDPRGMIRFFDEISENGNFGYSTLATAAKGRLIFEACVEDMVREVQRFSDEQLLLGL